MTKESCFLCEAGADRSDAEGKFARFYCQGRCGRYIISDEVIERIKALSPGTAGELKKSWSAKASQAQGRGMIAFWHLGDDRQIVEDQVAQSDDKSVWAMNPW